MSLVKTEEGAVLVERAIKPRSALYEFVRNQQIAEQFLEKGWAEIPSSVPSLFSPIMRGFDLLVKDTERGAWKIDALMEHRDNKPDLGLLEQRKGEKKPDPRPDEVAEGRIYFDEDKFLLHINARLVGYLFNGGADIKRYAEMLFAGIQANSSCYLLALAIAENLDRVLPGFHFFERTKEGEHDTLTRSIIYPYGERKGKTKARPHRDQCFITVHVKSSFPGLSILDNNQKEVPVNEATDDKVLVFPGRKFFSITKGIVKGTLHGVMERRKGSLVTPRFERRIAQEDRKTLVAFIHCTVTPEEKIWEKENVSQLKFDQEKM